MRLLKGLTKNLSVTIKAFLLLMQKLEGNFEGHCSSLRSAFNSSIVNAEIQCYQWRQDSGMNQLMWLIFEICLLYIKKNSIEVCLTYVYTCETITTIQVMKHFVTHKLSSLLPIQESLPPIPTSSQAITDLFSLSIDQFT